MIDFLIISDTIGNESDDNFVPELEAEKDNSNVNKTVNVEPQAKLVNDVAIKTDKDNVDNFNKVERVIEDVSKHGYFKFVKKYLD